MSYATTHLDRRGAADRSSPYERQPPAWGATYVPPSQRPYGQSPLQHLQAQHAAARTTGHDDMEAEKSDSDVSVTRGDYYSMSSAAANPARIPPAPARIESKEAIDRRLKELSQVEDQNSNKTQQLNLKRQRMDERIRQKREAQDRKIKAIMDARQRHDTRIAARRAREDIEFSRIFDQIEQEENKHRRNLKRLKRGLPLDESPQMGGRSISAASNSPPGPSYSTIPPPAKRHQSNPPGSNNSPAVAHAPPPAPPPPAATSQAPSYSFYDIGTKARSSPHNAASSYSTAPPASLAAPPPAMAQSQADRLGFGINGSPASPLARSSPSTAAPVKSTLSTAPPPRAGSSTYDTRPPPPTAASGFATVNTAPPPPTSGFATINARSAATPPGAHSHMARPEDPHKPSLTPTYSDGGKPGSNSSTPAAGKRTPSTTHPYQMSEAFANRHHHCERVDELQRGIWTSYGSGGTQDNPTGPAVEMYLRCNHDDCRRIDWRTVHGLQCHIVKSHEQPKGTIGSLEKALDRYGVPVKEVLEYEREHGEGTGGTMADPKNLKIKNKTREASSRGKSTPGSHGLDPTARPAGYKPSPTASPTVMHSLPKYGSGLPENSTNSATPTGAPKIGWNSINSGSPYGPRPVVDADKQLQGDAVMKDAPDPATSKAPSSTTSTSERKPYDYAPRPFEYPSRAPPTMPGSGRSLSTQSRPAWASGLESKPKPQSPPANRTYLSTWGSRPVWGTDPRTDVATKIANDANTKEGKIEQQTAAEKLGEAKKDQTSAAGGLYASAKPATAASTLNSPRTTVQISTQASTSAKPLDDGSKTISESAKPAAASTVPTGDSQGPSNPTDAATMDNPNDTRASAETKDMEPPSTGKDTIGPASGTRSAQSPSPSTKPLSAPTSIRRGSRRSSVALGMGRRVSVGAEDDRNGAALPSTNVVGAAEAAEGKKAVTAEPVAAPKTKNREDEATQQPGAAATDNKEDAEEADGESITVTARKNPSAAVAEKEKEKEKEKDKGDGKDGEKDGKDGAESTTGSLKEQDRIEPRTPPRRAASGRFTRKRTFGY